MDGEKNIDFFKKIHPFLRLFFYLKYLLLNVSYEKGCVLMSWDTNGMRSGIYPPCVNVNTSVERYA